MKKYILVSLLIGILSALYSSPIHANSEYFLPYPSAMPGSIWHKAELILETLQKYWYTGNLTQFAYNLKQADKYLVEAKTLFEYQQYLLGYEALKKSDRYFKNTPEFLKKAESEQKNISDKKVTLKNASGTHRAVLEKLIYQIPESFTWQPEKARSVELPLHKALRESIQIRSEI